MKKLMLAAVLGLGVAVAGGVEAGVFCKNDKGETYEWHIGWDRPLSSANFEHLVNSGQLNNKNWDIRYHQVFNHGKARDIVCFVNAETYRSGIANMNLPYVAGIGDSVAGMNGNGVMYRGDNAEFLIDNLPSVYGNYTTKEYYNSANP